MKTIKKSSEQGIALLLVLWLLVLLTVIVGQFCYSMRTEINITRNFRDETMGYYLARAGLNRAILHVLYPQAANQPVAAYTENESALPWRINTKIAPVSFAGGHFQVAIANENGKINLNAADPSMLMMMIQPFNLPDEQQYTIVASIRDWRDKDHLHRNYGAENDYYQTLDPPYTCNNGPFRSIEELLLVRGVTRELYDQGLKNMVTVYKDKVIQKQTLNQQQKLQENIYKININAAPHPVLRCFPNITEEHIQEITAFRLEKDFKYVNEFRKIVGPEVYQGISQYLTVDESTFYTIRATGMMDGALVNPAIEAVVRINRKREEYDIIKWLDYIDRSR